MPSEKKTKSFLIFVDRKKELDKMSDEQVGRLFRAIFDYVDSGALPIFNELALDLMFSVFKSQIDANSEKYAEKSERNKKYYQQKKENSANSENSVKVSTIQPIQKIQSDSAYDTDTYTDTDTDTITDTVTDTDTELHIMSNKRLTPNGAARAPQKRFTPPTIDDVSDYCAETGKPIDAEAFVNYYASKGWKVGSSPMKDWKATVRNWRKRDEQNGQTFSYSRKTTTQVPDESLGSSIDIDAFEAMVAKRYQK